MRPRSLSCYALNLLILITVLAFAPQALAELDQKEVLYAPGSYCSSVQNARFGNNLAAGDLDADGFDDLVILNTGSGDAAHIYYGSATGYMSKTGSLDLLVESVAIADLNNDGYDDIVLNYYDYISVYYGTPPGNRLPPPSPQTPDWEQQLPHPSPITTQIVAVDDYDGDGIEDVLALLGSSPIKAFAILGFDSATASAPGGPLPILAEEFRRANGAVGDLNGDGDPERTLLLADGGAGQPAVQVIDGSTARTTWGWGQNADGQIGDGTTTQRLAPTIVGSNEQWTDVAVGNSHTIALRSNGTLWTWGDNSSYQCGDGTQIDRVSPVQIGRRSFYTEIAAGTHHSLAIRSNGSLWAWGSNSYGQLGVGDIHSRPEPTLVGSDYDWVAVGAGRSFTLAIKEDGSLWAWGQNSYGQLGDGTTTNRLEPRRIDDTHVWLMADGGQYHSVALREDGSLWAWGSNGFGEVGDGTTTDRHTPVPVVAPGVWAFVDAGHYSQYNAAIRSDGSLWMWGSNGPNTPTQVGSDRDWFRVSAGYFHSGGIRNDGSLWMWGSNYYGTLGDGTTTNRSDPTQIGSDHDWTMVVAGNAHTMALRAPDHALWQVDGIAGETSSSFGERSVGTGDMDGDGYGDLCITDPWYDGGPPQGVGYWGRVHIWYGGAPGPGDPLGLGVSPDPTAADIMIAGNYADGAHRFVACGDLDGNGLADLAVGDRRAAVWCFDDDNQQIIVESGTVTTYMSLYPTDTPPATLSQTLLHPCQPNPFNPRTTIRYDLGVDARVSIKVYDVRGQLVASLRDREETAGHHELIWDGRDAQGKTVASGVYHCQLIAGDWKQTTKMALIR